MRLPLTLSLYLARQFIATFLTVLVGLLAIVFIGELLEFLRRASAHPEVTYGIVVTMAALKLPETAQVILPSAMLFTGLYFFWKFSRSHELEVTRAAGVSVWNFLAPVALAATLLGVIEVTLVNPMSAAMIGRVERMEDKFFRGRPTTLDISSAGVWISQADKQGQAFIHAEALRPGSFELEDVIVFENPTDLPRSRRIDAELAVLVPGAWELRNAVVHGEGARSERQPVYRLPTDLTQTRIEDSFASPNSLSFWQLPDFINTLDAAGLSSVRHQLHFQSLLAKPFLLGAMVVLAAVFGLRHARRGGVFSAISVGLMVGLLLFVLNDVIQTFAQSGVMPVLLAAWGPPLVGILGGAAALFHFEDG
jgi:lipopolysaccharide export system permease protein